MTPPNIIAAVIGAFLGKLDHATMFAAAVIVLIWWIYKETIWRSIRAK